MNKTAIITLFLVSSANIAFSAEWEFYFKSANGSSSYIDVKSMNKLKNGNVRAWTKYINESEKGTLSLKEIDCEERTYTIRAMEPTDLGNSDQRKALNLVMKNWSEPTQAWEQIGTSDLEEREYEVFCGNGN